MKPHRFVILTLAFAGAVAAMPSRAFCQAGDNEVVKMLEPIREQYKLPALGAAVVTSEGLVSKGVAGVRKKGGDVPVTIDDQWHLGSDTKAMTAVVVATLVERGKLSWSTTLGSVFPDLAATFPEDFRQITVEQLLSHHAGQTSNLDWRKLSRSAPDVTDQRLNVVKTAAATRLSSRPGTTYEYSNLGYVIAGAVAERAGGKPWETLMRDFVFTPLGMTSCGFGGLGTAGKVDQPWPHDAAGKPAALNGPLVDNPAVMGPAGTVHCSIADWSRFIADQLRGAQGKSGILKAETYTILQTPHFGGDYAFGWLVTSRPWAGGRVLTHSGSNTANFCVVWIAPARDLAVLAVTNQGGEAAQKGTDAGVSALILARNK
jgi:CubicO group peptidase (beta-lactamase class C family)